MTTRRWNIDWSSVAPFVGFTLFMAVVALLPILVTGALGACR